VKGEQKAIVDWKTAAGVILNLNLNLKQAPLFIIFATKLSTKEG